MLLVEFVIDGPPRSHQTHNRPLLMAWIGRVRAAAAERWTGTTPHPGQVRVVVTYYHEGTIARLDADTMVKPILDALIGVAYLDDRQAAHIEVVNINFTSGSRMSGLTRLLAERLEREGEFLHVRVEEL
jgi:crossover junction endodeoxyribonuclease RusA